MARNSCIKCMNNIDGNDAIYECDMCRKKFHKDCAGLSSSEERVMPLKKRTLMLICEPCRNIMQKVSGMLDGLETIKKDVEEVKNFIKDKEEMQYQDSDNKNVSQKPRQTPKTYKEALVDNKKEVLIVKPREKKNVGEVRKKLVEKIDPANLEVDVNFGKNIKDGGVILECGSNEEAETVMRSIEQNLGNEFVVRQPKRVFPKIKIIKVPKDLGQDDNFRERLIKQNRLQDDNIDFHLEVIHVTKELLKGFVNIVAEVDSKTLGILISKEFVNIGLYRSKVYEYVNIIKCFKCQGYNHFAKECTVETNICPKCGKNHKLEECKVNKFSCINCIKANEKFNLNLNTEHAVWDRSCKCLLKVEESKKQKMLYK